MENPLKSNPFTSGRRALHIKRVKNPVVSSIFVTAVQPKYDKIKKLKHAKI